MKLTKKQLKGVVKQCIIEVLRENPRLGTALVKEAIVDMFGDKLLTGDVVHEARSPKKTNVPAMMRKKPARARNAKKPNSVEEMAEPTDLFEALAADTMMHTLPDQVAKDRSTPTSRSWADMIHSEEALEEGPAARLRQAAMMPEPQRPQTSSAYTQYQSVQQSSQPVQQPYPPAQQQALQQTAALDQLSPSQLKAMYEAQQRDTDTSTPGSMTQQADDMPDVPDDLAALGITLGRWDAAL